MGEPLKDALGRRFRRLSFFRLKKLTAQSCDCQLSAQAQCQSATAVSYMWLYVCVSASKGPQAKNARFSAGRRFPSKIPRALESNLLAWTRRPPLRPPTKNSFAGTDVPARGRVWTPCSNATWDACGRWPTAWCSTTATRTTWPEVFLRATKGLAQFKGTSRFSTWLFRITVNTTQRLDRRGRGPQDIGPAAAELTKRAAAWTRTPGHQQRNGRGRGWGPGRADTQAARHPGAGDAGRREHPPRRLKSKAARRPRSIREYTKDAKFSNSGWQAI